MLYLDHASTSFPKDPRVVDAVAAALRDPGVAPDRGTSERGRRASRIVAEARSQVAQLLAVDAPERVTFTLNATDALNLAIKGVLRPGDEVVTTQVEHNSVVRPLNGLARRYGVVVKVAAADRFGVVAAESLLRLTTSRTRCIVMAHVSNVTGALQPVADVGRALGSSGTCGRPLLFVDAAQSAGYRDLAEVAAVADGIAGAGHKGPGGPLGTGFLWVRDGVELVPLREGGTGSRSELPEQPREDPGALEAGSPNVPGLAGLAAAIALRRAEGVGKVQARRAEITAAWVEQVAPLKEVEFFGPRLIGTREPVFPVRVHGWSVAEAARLLESEFGIEQRAGLHCAPGVHEAIGTAGEGTLRLSFGPHPAAAEVAEAVAALRELSLACPGRGP